MQKTEPKKDWALTQQAFHHLLNWLDSDTDSNGQKYLEMRQRLVAYFDRKNCTSPDELADETLNRVARRLEEEGSIDSDTPARYCYIVARFVFMEYLRGIERNQLSLDDLPHQPADHHLSSPESKDAEENQERLLECLDRCTEKLEPQSRELIAQYYHGEQRVKIENRRRLAARCGMTQNALSIRACRIRDKLEACVNQCVSIGKKESDN